MLWQLKKLSSGEALNEPQKLPENWGSIFGMEGVKDRLGDLSWLGIEDKAWVEVEVADPVFDMKGFIDSQITRYLEESLSMVAEDNVSLTKSQRTAWVEYRRKLQEIYLQPDYPTTVFWPNRPE